MEIVRDIISWALILGGIYFCVVGGYGMVKLKDMYARLHAASLIDTLGVGLVLIGLMFQAHQAIVVFKLFLVLVFVFFTSPTATHALTKAAINHDILPEVDTEAERESVRAAKTGCDS